ncbi:MAG: response regulator [Phycisphaera sp.]|nr:response regulator [Phycisphaera sp.]
MTVKPRVKIKPGVGVTITLLIMAVVFVCDVLMDVAVDIGVLYSLAVLFSMVSGRPKVPFAVAAIGTALVGVAAVVRWSGGGDHSGVAVSCVLSVAILWLVAWTGYALLRTLADRSQLAEIIDTTDAPVFRKTLDGTILSWNRGAELQYGYKADEVIGQPVTILIPPERHDEFDEIMACIRRGESVVNHETVRVRKDGTRFNAMLTVSPIRAGEGEVIVIGASSFTRDITALKETEAELEEARARADAASRAKSTFLSNMSHEIRTPLNGVIGMLELMADTPLNTEQKDYVETAQSSADLLMQVINDILDISKIEAGKFELDPMAFNLHDAVADIMRVMAVRGRRHGVEVVYDLRPDVPMSIVADRARLTQVLVNLAGNAVKFTEQGEVVLTVEVEERTDDRICLHFRVQDTGIGIAPDRQEAIFRAFEQQDAAVSRRFGGTGLGLAICGALVGMMGGEIWLESKEGRGSTFHFTGWFGLDLEGVTRPLTHKLAILSDVPVLLIDDNKTNRRILGDLLSNWGCACRVAANIGDAWKHLEDAQHAGDPICLVVCDVMMGEENGYDLVERMRADTRFKNVPVIMLSSSENGHENARAQELKVAARLLKPAKRSVLLNHISTALAEHMDRLDEQVDAIADASADAAPAKAALRILLAEDNPVNRKLASALLAKWGHTVVCAVDGREAVARVAAERFDLVLMDLRMPEMDGDAATAEIRAMEKTTDAHVPIIAVSASADVETQARCLEAGMDAYITKPYRAENLRSAIDKLFDRPDAGDGAA